VSHTNPRQNVLSIGLVWDTLARLPLKEPESTILGKRTSDRIVAHDITDMDGYFYFRLVNPDDRIRVSYVGYETVNIPIDTTFFEIKMKEQDDLPPVEITTDPGYKTTGIPIPLRDIQ
jgi:hypothetical protein